MRAARRLLLVALATLIGLAFAELLTRFQEARAPAPEKFVAPALLHLRDPELGHRVGPNISVTLERADFSTLIVTNSLGFRDAEIGPKDAATFRILSLGDSYAFGYGVEVEDTYADRLENLLNESSDAGYRFEVINAGVSGYGTYQQLWQLKRHAAAVDPDLVMLSFFTGNDFKNNLVTTGRFEEEFERGLTGWLGRHSRFFARMAPRIKNAELKLLTREGVEVTMQALAELQRECEKLGVPLAMLMITPAPAEFEAYYARIALRRSLDRALGFEPRVRLKQLAADTRALGIPVLDMLELLEAMNLSSEELILPVSGHWSPLGHRIAAEALRDFLFAEGLLPGRDRG